MASATSRVRRGKTISQRRRSVYDRVRRGGWIRREGHNGPAVVGMSVMWRRFNSSGKERVYVRNPEVPLRLWLMPPDDYRAPKGGPTLTIAAADVTPAEWAMLRMMATDGQRETWIRAHQSATYRVPQGKAAAGAGAA
jgi:hypothetical protein